MSDPVVERLDQVLAVLRIANADALERASQRLRSEPAKAAALDACADGPVQAGKLTKAVMAKTKLGNSTVRQHLADLVTAGALVREGAGPNTNHRSSGVI
jgi:hypothetical protein